MVNYFKKNYHKGSSDNTKIVNGNRRGSVTFPTDHDTKPEACADPSAPEGFLDKYLSHRWVVTYMCSLMFVALPMLQNCITMALVCMESNYIEPTSNKNLSKATNNISGKAETNVNIDINGSNLFLYCWFIKILCTSFLLKDLEHTFRGWRQKPGFDGGVLRVSFHSSDWRIPVRKIQRQESDDPHHSPPGRLLCSHTSRADL